MDFPEHTQNEIHSLSIKLEMIAQKLLNVNANHNLEHSEKHSRQINYVAEALAHCWKFNLYLQNNSNYHEISDTTKEILKKL